MKTELAIRHKPVFEHHLMAARGEEKITVAVIVDVDEEGSRSSRGDLDAGFFRSLAEGAVTLVEIEEVATMSCGKGVEKAVSVEVGNGHAVG